MQQVGSALSADGRRPGRTPQDTIAEFKGQRGLAMSS
jgi:hypothetical protein